MEAKERKEKHCGYSMSNRLRSQEKVFLGTLRQRRRYQAFRIVSEQEQRDQGGDPDESDQEGQ